MKFKLLISALVAIITCLSIFVVVLIMHVRNLNFEIYASNNSIDEHFTMSYAEFACEYCCPYIYIQGQGYVCDCFVYSNPLFNRADIFEDRFGNFPIGLRYMTDLFPHQFTPVTRQFGLINHKGYTYFNFTEDVMGIGGELSLVIFAEAAKIFENEDLNYRDSIVIAEIDGELHHVWLNAGEIWPYIVAPIRIHLDDFHCTSALLVVADNPAGSSEIFVLFFEEYNLQVRWLHPSFREVSIAG
jgi:hypothetical protein